jgi:hypothetical protein
MNADNRIQEAQPVVPAAQVDMEVRELPSIVVPKRRWTSPANLALLSIQVIIALIVWVILAKLAAMIWSWKLMADAWPRLIALKPRYRSAILRKVTERRKSR